MPKLSILRVVINLRVYVFHIFFQNRISSGLEFCRGLSKIIMLAYCPIMMMNDDTLCIVALGDY